MGCGLCGLIAIAERILRISSSRSNFSFRREFQEHNADAADNSENQPEAGLRNYITLFEEDREDRKYRR